MRVQVIPFGVLKDRLGSSAATVELPEGASVADLLDHLRAASAARGRALELHGIAVSVNAEYARAAQILCDGDEVGLLPPVSGGQPEPAAGDVSEKKTPPNVIVALTRQRIGSVQIVPPAQHPEDGAVVVFDGVVRNHSRGRRTLFLDYEAYEAMAERCMRELGHQARERFGVRHVTMIHRLGRLEIGETSVLIIVASAHRTAAFEACRWLIDTLKQTVPIWKKETFEDGVEWAPGEPFPMGLTVDAAEAPHEA